MSSGSTPGRQNECGLDQYEVRRYPGWHRHITSTVPVTLAEIRRLLDVLLPRPEPPNGPIAHALS
ncbi:hypothetical protein [Streptomyces sp. XD-27]|uniref:hypothetical protein n=1 Tax=Streptomyces sp. XD-27 TaxID=3062779 RepID=UPI0026F43318|nr:hypothetical protein [Streptomyces sp. XD-27]WKX73757.1 hypothetical protein Q3Y56_31265 [Streptomyces sp. XD-27]